MPQSINPSRELLARQAESRVRKEMPDVADVPIEHNLGLLMKLKQLLTRGELLGGYSGGSIQVNPEVVGGPQYEGMLVHELTHARQRNKEGFLTNLYKRVFPDDVYARRESELEARQAEKDYSLKRGIQYPIGDPSFENPEVPQMRGDINLPSDMRFFRKPSVNLNITGRSRW